MLQASELTSYLCPECEVIQLSGCLPSSCVSVSLDMWHLRVLGDLIIEWDVAPLFVAPVSIMCGLWTLSRAVFLGVKFSMVCLWKWAMWWGSLNWFKFPVPWSDFCILSGSCIPRCKVSNLFGIYVPGTRYVGFWVFATMSFLWVCVSGCIVSRVFWDLVCYTLEL